MRFPHGKHTGDEDSVRKDEEEGPAKEGTLAARKKLQVKEEAEEDGHKELPEVIPQTTEASGAEIEEITVVIVTLVRNIPKACETVREEENDVRFALDG